MISVSNLRSALRFFIRPKLHTPLSKLMADCDGVDSQHRYLRFVRACRRSSLGIVAAAKPTDPRDKLLGASRQTITLDYLIDGAEHRYLYAFAHPSAYVAKAAKPFNAEVTGATLLTHLQTYQNCDGIVVYSATSNQVMIITREVADSLRSPWW